jgi:hypothetical protein
MIVLEAKSEPRSGSMGSGGSSPSGEQGQSPASNSQSKSFRRNHVVLPLKAGQFCLLIDDSQGGRFPDALYDENVMRPVAGIYRADRVAAKTFVGFRFDRRGQVEGEGAKRQRREFVIAVFDTLEQTMITVDQVNALARHARVQEDIERKKIRIHTHNEILSLFPETYSIQKGAA